MTDNPTTIDVPAGVPFIDIVREFDAPVADVYRAHADPALVKRWLGPLGYEMEIDEWELRPGGGYRYVHTDPAGEQYRFHGVFHAARENEFIIQTFEFGGYPDVVSVESMRFEDLGDGRTRLSGHAVYPSMEARDGMAASGMEKGVNEGHVRLDEVLSTLRA